MFKLAIVATHPIQYNAPWFKLLSDKPELNVKVFYTWYQSQSGAKFDPGFGKIVKWDIPLLEGYQYQFIQNVAKDPGSHHFNGIINPSLNKEIEEWKADAVLVIGWSYKSHLSCLKYFKGKIPVLFRGDSTLLDEKKSIKRIARRLFLKYVYSFIDYALYVGTNNKKYFLKHGLKESQLWYVPHAVDNDRFSNTEGVEEKAAELKKQLAIDDNHSVVFFSGKLEKKKDPHFILELAERIKEKEFRFLFIGNGPLESELKEKAAKDNRIIFLDFQNQNNMPVVYRVGDVYILPSQGPGETWGLAINEAMACGKPVVASDKTGCAIDLIKPDENGFIINERNLQETVSFLKKVMNDKIKLKEMGEASKEIIKPFSFEEIVSRTTELLNQIKFNKQFYLAKQKSMIGNEK